MHVGGDDSPRAKSERRMSSQGEPEVLWRAESMKIGTGEEALSVRPQTSNPFYNSILSSTDSSGGHGHRRASVQENPEVLWSVTPKSVKADVVVRPKSANPKYDETINNTSIELRELRGSNEFADGVLWASDGANVDPSVLGRPKTSKGQMSPVMHPQKREYVGDVIGDEVLWARSSANVANTRLARPHSSNPHLATFFHQSRDGTPETVTAPSGEVMWSHDDNVYDLRQVVEEQRDRITKLETMVADLVSMLKRQNIQVPSQAPSRADSVIKPLESPLSPQSDLPRPMAVVLQGVGHGFQSSKPLDSHDTDTVVLDFLSPVKPIIMTQSPRPVATVADLRQRRATTEDQHVSTPPPARMGVSMSITPDRPVVSNDFGVSAAYTLLLVQNNLPLSSTIIPKSAFRAMFRKMEVIGAPLSERRLAALLGKYNRAGEDSLTLEEFGVLYLRLVKM